MIESIYSRIYSHIVQIGDDLLTRIKEKGDTVHFESISINSEWQPHVSENRSTGIYSGLPGIMLFFIQLYKLTGDGKYLRFLERCADSSLMSFENPAAHSSAFYTGGMGSVYVLLQLYELTEDKVYLQKALELTRQLDLLLTNKSKSELLGGAAGTLLVLLHLHSYTGEDWVQREIENHTLFLIRSAHFDRQGMFWDRSGNNVRGLCGFSHGAAGIGFVFLELGHYYGINLYHWIAEQAFRYENQFFNPTTGNWPDFRKKNTRNVDIEENKAAYKENVISHFTSSGNFSAWCHGAAGIGFSRLRAYELLNKEVYLDDFRKCIHKVLHGDLVSVDEESSFTLCHGAFGNASLLLAAYNYFGEAEYLNQVLAASELALRQYQKTGYHKSGYPYPLVFEDPGLFMGAAGIGYFLIQTLKPGEVPYILSPKLPESQNPIFRKNKNLDLFLAKEAIACTKFKNVLAFLAQNSLQAYAELINFLNPDTNCPDTIDQKVLQWIESRSYHQPLLKNLYEVDLTKLEMESGIGSYLYYSTKEDISTVQAKSLLTAKNRFKRLVLTLNKETKFIKITKPHTTIDGFSHFLLMPSHRGIVEFRLSLQEYILINSFGNAASVASVINSMKTRFDFSSDTEEMKLEEILYQQLSEILAVGILEIREEVDETSVL